MDHNIALHTIKMSWIFKDQKQNDVKTTSINNNKILTVRSLQPTLFRQITDEHSA